MSSVDSELLPIEDQLRRSDKWFLGGGRKVLWAPEWPLWLDRPGFWDHACFYDLAVGPVFTVTFLDEHGREIPLLYENRTWVPSHLTQAYSGEGLEITERRALLPDDVLASDFLITNPGDAERCVQIILWTCQSRSGRPEGHDIDRCEQAGDTLLLRHQEYAPAAGADQTPGSGQLNYDFVMAYGGTGAPVSHSIHLSEGAPNHPRWDLTPFYEAFRDRLDGADLAGVTANRAGLLYAALHYTLRVPPGETADFVAACAIARTEVEALENLAVATGSSDPIEISADNWEGWFRSIPEFRCSDPYLETAYWYRWYGLKLNRVNARTERLPHPCVFEGINRGWFRHAISYSAQVHMLEICWMHDPDLATGILRNFIVHQREDGSFPGCILTGHAETPTGFYHANWGKAVRALHVHHADDAFLHEIYPALARYADYLCRERDPEGSGLFDVIDQGETGQEYMARYLFARPDADDWGPFRLKGVDATVYAYELMRCLEWMAGHAGNADEAARWAGAADATRAAVRERMWDPDRGFFVDVRPGTYDRSPALAAVGFYPFMTDIATAEHLRALTDHLMNPEEFRTPWPVPSTSKSDSSYSAAGEWKGKRMACPWNGRAWLMTGSHVAEALASTAQRLDRGLEAQAVDLLDRFIRMPFLDRDVRRPSSYEYYNPETGAAPYFRGTDDYMHSYIADLILRYVAGVQVEAGRLVIDPLPFEVESFFVDRIPAAGHWVRVVYRRAEGMRVYVDGGLVSEDPERGRIEVPLG